MSVLIICEKPSVAKTVALALGAAEQKDGYLSGDGLLVSWCIGHLISMADAGSYDERYKKWRYEDLPILPQAWKYAPTPGKEKQLAVLKELLHRSDVSEVVNGCDAGREGELIFRTVYCLAGCQKPMKRLWISSMEDSAIRDGFAHLRPGADYDGPVSYTHLDVYKRQDAASECRTAADQAAELTETGEIGLLRLVEILCAAKVQRGQAGGAVLEGTEVQILADVVAQLYACLTECRFVGPLGLAAYAELSSMAASLMLGEWFD